jgi:glycerate kinase
MAQGVRRTLALAQCELCPMADGGEGTVDAFLERGAVRKVARVRGPLGDAVDAAFALDGTTAILEMARASGLGLLARERYDPIRSDTFGTGQLIRAALDAGATQLIVGIGGSATNDAGVGMLRALGVRFLDAAEREIDGSILNYAALATIDLQSLDARLRRTRIEMAVDVDNPLWGPDGAARMFAAQKGATPAQIEQLDDVVHHIANVAARTFGHDDSNVPGAGAAGGLGFALVTFLGAKAEPGARLVARTCGLDRLLKGADLCLTGEGKIDLQTLHGKTVAGVTDIARAHGVPVIAFAGAVDPEAAAQLRMRGAEVVQIAPPGTPVAESIRSAARFLQDAAASAVAQAFSGRAS